MARKKLSNQVLARNPSVSTAKVNTITAEYLSFIHGDVDGIWVPIPSEKGTKTLADARKLINGHKAKYPVNAGSRKYRIVWYKCTTSLQTIAA